LNRFDIQAKIIQNAGNVMNSKWSWLLLLAALAGGFCIALLAAGVHSTFFVLLPILAFVLGFISSRGVGLICGLLIGFSYTFTLALMWEVRWALIGFTQYFGAFIFGGFNLPLIGYLAPLAREGIKKTGAIIALVVLVIALVGGFYVSIPRYHYSYGLNIMCEENTEIFVPIAIASNGFSAKIVKNTIGTDGNNFSRPDEVEIVETEYGQMWHLKMTSHMNPAEGQLGISSNWYQGSNELRAWPGLPPENMLQLSSKMHVQKVNIIQPDGVATWPCFITNDYVVEQFKTPVKVRSENPVKYQIIISCNIDRTSGLNFGYQKSESYVLRNNWYDGITGDDWAMVPVEALDAFSLRGMGD
jgi:hypothetical protein